MIRIYGASDDLIEVEGDISEEFTYLGDDDQLAFSDGTLLNIRYDTHGIWRLSVLYKGQSRLVHQVCTSDGFEDDEYSDVIHLFDEELEKPISWVMHGCNLGRRRR